MTHASKKVGAKSKWGRHSCRPHSHRCVVFLPGEPFRKRLAPGVSASRPANRTCLLLSPALAPASGSVVGDGDPKIAHHAFRRFRDRAITVGRSSRTVLRGLRLAIPRLTTGSSGPCRPCFRVLLERCTCFRSKPSAGTPRRPRGQWPPCRIGLKIFKVFRSLDRRTRSFSRRSDELRLRPESESRKLASPRFSTVPRFRCGHGWITQRFVAELPIALRKQAQPQRVELDEPRRIGLVVGSGVVLERHVRFGIE